jgi:ADP-ribose pyrophosphatase
VLVRQYRDAVDQETLEIPAGIRDMDGEDAAGCAARELLEETGYVAAEWTRLGVLQTTIGYSDETIELFLAKGLTLQAQKLDAGEFLEVLKVPFGEAIAMIGDGRITDAKSLAALLWVKTFLP